MCFGDRIQMKLYRKSYKTETDTEHGCTKDGYESSIDLVQDKNGGCSYIYNYYYKVEYVFSLDEGTDNI